MSYFDDASLVMIPSGYKTSKVYSVKPTDGTGDLTFTRSNDTATRVNSAGLIEKVRTNLATYSEEFDNAAWSKTNVSVTANNIANPLNGETTAELLDAGTLLGGHRIAGSSLSYTSGLTYTFSLYAKKGSTNLIQLFFENGVFGPNVFATYNLDTSSITNGSAATSSMEDLGGGWYRLTLKGVASVSTTGASAYIAFNVTPSVRNESFTGSNETFYIFGAQLEVSDFGATDYIATTSAAVSVGPVANVPRLDYLGSSCPRLLLEGQRVNLVTFSESFDNAAWTKSGTTISANAVTSPDGYTNADKIVATAANSSHYIEEGATIASGATNTFSVFAKKGEYNYLYMNAYANVSLRTWFNLDTGEVAFNTSGNTASIEDYGNGWYRCIVTNTSVGTTGILQFGPAITNGTTNSTPTFLGDGTSGIYTWGAQLEAGAYATSYIPTLGAAVTRGADAASKTGISSLIGQTEGVVFMDFIAQTSTTSQEHFWLEGVLGQEIGLYGSSSFIFYSSGGVSINGGSFVTGQRYKIAFAYKANDYVAYINGVQVGTDTSATVPTMSKLFINTYVDFSNPQKRQLNQFLLFKTRLSNADLAALTA